MAKRFKLRISRVITTTFQSCRSKDPSNLPENPVPSFFRFTPLVNSHDQLISVGFPVNPPPNSRPHDRHRRHGHRSSFRHNVSSAFISFDCGFTSKSAQTNDSDDQRSRSQSQEFKWRKEEKWHVIYEENRTPRRKIYNSSVSGGSDHDSILASPPPPPPPVERKKRRGKKKRIPTRLRMSTSSADQSGLFSSELEEEKEEDDDETESLVVSSSRSFLCTDSSNRGTPVIRRRHRKNKKKDRSSSVTVTEGEDDECWAAARLSVFKKVIGCSVDGKVKESFAIVKKSEEPYEDFKRSMMEMIVEKQMFEVKELEQLLECFLSLNSRNYHALIVQAFSEIWDLMFNYS